MAINFQRLSNSVVITTTGMIDFGQFANAASDKDFSLDWYQTGHLTLLDDHQGKVFLLNDHWLDVIQELNQHHYFSAPLSILEYEIFSDK